MGQRLSGRRRSTFKDSDRVFTNLYGFQSPFLDGARARGDWDQTKSLMEKGREQIIEEVKARPACAGAVELVLQRV